MAQLHYAFHMPNISIAKLLTSIIMINDLHNDSNNVNDNDDKIIIKVNQRQPISLCSLNISIAFPQHLFENQSIGSTETITLTVVRIVYPSNVLLTSAYILFLPQRKRYLLSSSVFLLL